MRYTTTHIHVHTTVVLCGYTDRARSAGICVSSGVECSDDASSDDASNQTTVLCIRWVRRLFLVAQSLVVRRDALIGCGQSWCRDQECVVFDSGGRRRISVKVLRERMGIKGAA